METRNKFNDILYSKDRWLTKEERFGMDKPILIQFLIDALKDNFGIIKAAIEHANIDRGSFLTYLKKYPDFKKEYDNIQENQIDFVERKLYDIINEGHANTIQFYLRTKGKQRGYQESILNQNMNQDIKIGFSDDDLDIDENNIEE